MILSLMIDEEHQLARYRAGARRHCFDQCRSSGEQPEKRYGVPFSGLGNFRLCSSPNRLHVIISTLKVIRWFSKLMKTFAPIGYFTNVPGVLLT